jgi:cell division protein FtsZ
MHPSAQAIRSTPSAMSHASVHGAMAHAMGHAPLGTQLDRGVDRHSPPTSARGMRPAVREMEEIVTPQTRRAPARDLATHSAQPHSSGSPRDRASFVPPLDADWDTPAFQRRGNS